MPTRREDTGRSSEFIDTLIQNTLDIQVDSTAALHVREAAGAAGDFDTIIDTVNERVGMSLITGAFTPLFSLHVEAEGASQSLARDFYSNTSSNNWNCLYRRARGTKAAPLACGDDDDIFEVMAQGHDGAAFSDAAAILIETAGVWAPDPGGNHGGRIVMKTRPQGAATALTDRYTFEDNGDLHMNGDNDFEPAVDNDGDVGTAALRWTLVRAVTVTAGDLKFENGMYVTEDDERDGLSFRDLDGTELFAIRRDGLWYKGKKIA